MRTHRPIWRSGSLAVSKSNLAVWRSGDLSVSSDRIGQVPGFISDTFDAIADVVTSGCDRIPGCEILADAAASVEDVVRWWWDTFKYVNIWVGPYVWYSETAGKIVSDINEGRPVGRAVRQALSAQGKEYARSLQKASPYIAMVPGIGTGLAIAMNASAAIALGQPVDQMAVDTIALSVPGGAVAQRGFRAGADIGVGMIRGERFDESAANAIRAQLPEQARIAYDAGLALARGKSLQDAGFQVLYYYTKGNDLVDRAAHFAEAVVRAAKEGKSVGQVLADETTRDLARLGGPYLDRLAEIENLANRIIERGEADDLGKVLVETRDYGRALQLLSTRYNTSPDVVRAAMSILTWSQPQENAPAVPAVDPGKLYAIDIVRRNLRPPPSKALRNTNLIRPAIEQVRMPLWLAQTEASIAQYEPPRIEPPPVGRFQDAPSPVVKNVIAPALLTAPVWLPWAAGAFLALRQK